MLRSIIVALLITVQLMPSSVVYAQAAGIQWLTNIREGEKQSLVQRKPLLLFFYAPDHSQSQQVENQALTNPAVRSAIAERFVPVKINVNEARIAAQVYQAADAQVLPRVVVIGADQKEVTRFTAVAQPDGFLKQLVGQQTTVASVSPAVAPASAPAAINSVAQPAAPSATTTTTVASVAQPSAPITTAPVATQPRALLPSGNLNRDLTASQASEPSTASVANSSLTPNTAPSTPAPTASIFQLPDVAGMQQAAKQQFEAGKQQVVEQYKAAEQQTRDQVGQQVTDIKQQAQYQAAATAQQAGQSVDQAKQAATQQVQQWQQSLGQAAGSLTAPQLPADANLSPRPSQNPTAAAATLFGMTAPQLPGMTAAQPVPAATAPTATTATMTSQPAPSLPTVGAVSVPAATAAVANPASPQPTGSFYSVDGIGTPPATKTAPVATAPTTGFALPPATAAPVNAPVAVKPQTTPSKPATGLSAYSTDNYQSYMGTSANLPSQPGGRTAPIATAPVTPASTVGGIANTPASSPVTPVVPVVGEVQLPAPTMGPATLNPPRTSVDAQLNMQHVGLDGYCPVTMVDRKSLVRGDFKYGAIHRGRTYLFVDEAAQKKFLAMPDQYSPVMSGHDPVYLFTQGQYVQGQRQFGGMYNGRLYLFANQASAAEFKANPAKYETAVFTAENSQGRITR